RGHLQLLQGYPRVDDLQIPGDVGRTDAQRRLESAQNGHAPPFLALCLQLSRAKTQGETRTIRLGRYGQFPSNIALQDSFATLQHCTRSNDLRPAILRDASAFDANVDIGSERSAR